MSSSNVTLGVFCPNNSDATSFYRGIGPLSPLRRTYKTDPLNYIFLNEVNWSTLALLDYAFMQRPFGSAHRSIAQLIKRQRIPLWVDYDDMLLEIPDDNPCKIGFGEKEKANIREILSIADIVTCSTPELLVQLSKYTDRCILLRNCFDDYQIPLSGPGSLTSYRLPEKQKLILWRGSKTHTADLDTIADDVLELSHSHPDWHWLFVGDSPWFTRRMPKKQTIVIEESLDTYEYMTLICQSSPSIMIVPLVNSTFNKCKSDCAWLEGTYAGAAVLAPDFQQEFNSEVCSKYPTGENLHGFKFSLQQMMQTSLDTLFAQNQKALDNMKEQRLLSKETTRAKILDYLKGLRT